MDVGHLPQEKRDRRSGWAGSLGDVTSAGGPAESPADTPAGDPPRRAAAFFDLDKTVIAKSSTLAMGGPLYRGGLIGRRAVLSGTYAQFVFLLNGADARRMDRMRDTITHLCRGWSVAQVREIVDQTLEELIVPMVHAEAVELIRKHQAEHRDVVLVSSSGAEVVEPIGDLLGVDHVVATRMGVEERLLHRRYRVLRVRTAQGDSDRPRSPMSAATPWPTVTPTPTRSPICRCSRRSAIPPP